MYSKILVANSWLEIANTLIAIEIRFGNESGARPRVKRACKALSTWRLVLISSIVMLSGSVLHIRLS